MKNYDYSIVPIEVSYQLLKIYQEDVQCSQC